MVDAGSAAMFHLMLLATPHSEVESLETDAKGEYAKGDDAKL